MPLNPGLTETQINERINRLECPMCPGSRLEVLLRREFATCHCCGVDYAKALDGKGVEWFVCRYLPDGHPHCVHYQAAMKRPNRPRLRRLTRMERLRSHLGL